MGGSALFTGSSWGRVRVCPPSAALPRIRTVNEMAATGSAGHEHLALRATQGVAVAVELLDETIQRWRLDDKSAAILKARYMRFEWSPPRGAHAEIPLCLCEDGTVQRVRGGQGEYHDLPNGGYYALTIDIMWAEPQPLIWSPCSECGGESQSCLMCNGLAPAPVCPSGSTLWVADYKNGNEANVSSIEENEQVISAALVAGRWTGAEVVYPVVIYPRRGMGLWDVPERAYAMRELDQVEVLLRGTRRDVLEQRRKLEAGEQLDYKTGPHCTYCPAETACSAKTALIRQFLEAPLPTKPEELSEDELRRLAESLPMVERFGKACRDLLRASVDARKQSLDLGGGKLWGPRADVETTFDEAEVRRVLAQEYGEDAVGRHLPPSEISPSKLEATVRAIHDELGLVRQVAPAVRKAWAKLIERGAKRTRNGVVYGVHKSNRALPATEEGSEQGNSNERVRHS